MALILCVHYPARGRRLAVRTSLDWETDVEPKEVSPDGDSLTFRVESQEPWIEFKVCLREADGSMLWSQGDNYVGSTSLTSTHEVYPTFVSSEHGRISEAIEVSAGEECQAHRVRVYVPPGYDENPYKRYPVVYMHDGTNLFFPEESFLGETWNVQGTLDALDGMNSIHPVLVVGVQPVDREAEYTEKGIDRYGRYLVNALKPVVDKKGRTLPEPENTVLMGSSLGGLASLALAWRWPKVFGGAACLSSTFGLDDEIFRRISKEPRRPIRVYIDSGYPKDNFEATLAMRDLLLRKGYHWGTDLLHFAHPGARHNEGDWALRLHLPFQFFFGRGPSYG